MNKKEIKYTTILHNHRKSLWIWMIEYCILDSIMKTQKNWYSWMSKEYIANFLWISERYVFECIKKLSDKWYIDKSSNWRLLKVDDKIIDVLIYEDSSYLESETLNKVHTNSEQSSYNNNIIDNNKDIDKSISSKSNIVNEIISKFTSILSSKQIVYDKKDERRWASLLSKNAQFQVLFNWDVVYWVDVVTKFASEDLFWWEGWKINSLMKLYYKFPTLINSMKSKWLYKKPISEEDRELERKKTMEELNNLLL